MFRYQRDLSEIGHLTESLISRAKLTKLLNAIHSELSVEYLYRHFNVRLMSLSGVISSLGFWVSIPIVSGEAYTLWRIQTAPFLFDGAVRKVQLDSPEVGVGLNSGKIIVATDCLYEKPRLCPAPIETRNTACIMGILSADKERIQQCRLELVKPNSDVIRKLGNGNLVLYSEGETLQERCTGMQIVTRELEPGSYMVQTRPGCVLSSRQGWRYRAMIQDRFRVNMTDVFVFDNLELEFNLIEPTPVPAGKYVETGQLEKLLVSHRPTLPDLGELRLVQVYSVAGGTVGIGGAVVALALVVVLLRWWCRRWWAERKPITPTTAAEPTAPAPVTGTSPSPAGVPTVPKLYFQLPPLTTPMPQRNGPLGDHSSEKGEE